MLGLHMQYPVPSWPRAIEQSQFTVFKSVMNFESVLEAWAAKPDLHCMVRQHIDHQQPYLDLAGQGEAEARQAARDYIAHFRDSVNAIIAQKPPDTDLYVASLNEIYSHDSEVSRKAAMFDRGFAQVLDDECPGALPATFSCAVGNPGQDVITSQLFLSMVRETISANGCLAYNAYWPVYNGNPFWHNEEVTMYLPMWWAVIDNFLCGQNLYPKWFLGEAGPVGSDETGFRLAPYDGWRHPSVYGGNVDSVLLDLAEFDSRVHQTAAYQESRFLGYVMFTTDRYDGGWPYFVFADDSMFALTEYSNNTPPPPPPAPKKWYEYLWDESLRTQCIPLNPNAALYQKIREHGYEIVGPESQCVFPPNIPNPPAPSMIFQPAEAPDKPRRVYWWDGGMVHWFLQPGTVDPVSEGDE